MRTERRLWISIVGLTILLTALGVTCGYLWLEQREQTKVAVDSGEVVATEGDDLAAEVQAACAAGGKAAEALKGTRACDQADRTRKVIEDAPTSVQGPAGPAGPPPSFATVVAAVEVELDDALARVCGGSCNGADGGDGKDGESVQGPPGESITGPAGPAGPKGDRGEKGETGGQGAPGRSVVDVSCTGGLTPMTFTYTFDDGSTRTITCGSLEPVDP